MSDEELDPCSSRFSALRALYGAGGVPRPEAPLLDNVATVAARLRGAAAPARGAPAPTPRQQAEDHAERTLKRFQPHQLPVKNVRKIQVKNIFTRMEKEEGPLAALKSSMEKKLRVKVVTRSGTGIRGHCIGFVQAFDNQWNLALSDVIEVWTRKRKKKVIAGFDDLKFEHLSLNEVRELGKDIPSVQITPHSKGIEKCERHIPQLMMRGEHVVLIVLLDSS